MSHVGDESLSLVQREQIDKLCEAMDREDILARSLCSRYVWDAKPRRPDGTILDEFRAWMIERARQGLPLPDRWSSDEMEAQIQKRLAEHGTREWRKAYPWIRYEGELAEYIAALTSDAERAA